MSTYFRELIKKNDLLDVYSNIMDTIYIRLLDNKKSIQINVSKETYCQFLISIGNVDGNIKLDINSQTIANIVTAGSYIIPIKVRQNDILNISGGGDNLIIMLQGAQFKQSHIHKFLPMNNKLISYGDNAILYDVNSAEDIVQNNLLEMSNLGSAKFLQTFISGGEYFIGKISIENGVYFSTSMDNYANATKILDVEPDDIIFIQDVSNQIIDFLYIISGLVYSKRFHNDMSLKNDEQEISIQSGKRPLSLIASESYLGENKTFGILYDDNSIDIMFKKNYANIQKVIGYSGKSLRIIEKDSSLLVLLKSDYSFDILTYNIDTSESGSNILSLASSDTIDNIVDCMYFDNKLICFGIGLFIWQKEIT